MDEQDREFFRGLSDGLIGALSKLGLGDASTPMGAIEALGLAIKEAGSDVAQGLAAIGDPIDRLAEAVERLAGAVASSGEQ